MKYLLTLALLLLASSGWAGEPVRLIFEMDDQAYVKLNRADLEKLAQATTILTEIPNAAVHIELVNDPCPAKMEAAMLAMDHWIAWNPAQVSVIAAAMKGEDAWAVGLLGSNQDRIAAIHLWEAVQHDCWRTP